MPQSAPTSRRAFTLLELLVVLAIIVLVVGSVVPSVARLLTAGSDAQAYNLLSAQLTAARGLAITKGTFAGVHAQMAAQQTGLEGNCYLAIMICKDVGRPGNPNMRFVLADGFTPRMVPGGFAFGELSDTYVTGSNFNSNLNIDSNIGGFLTFTVLFSPTGAVVKTVNGADIEFSGAELLFIGGQGKQLWDLSLANDGTGGEQGASAVTLLNYNEFWNAGANRNVYLDRNAQFIPINVYTGQLFPREFGS